MSKIIVHETVDGNIPTPDEDWHFYRINPGDAFMVLYPSDYEIQKELPTFEASIQTSVKDSDLDGDLMLRALDTALRAVTPNK